MMLLPGTSAHPLRASATVVWFAVFLLLHAAFAQLPPEWQQAVEDSDLLFSPDDSFAVVPANIQATLGNGFLATQMRRQGSSSHSRTTVLPSNAPHPLAFTFAAPRSILPESSTGQRPQIPPIAPALHLPSTSTSKPQTPATEWRLSQLVRTCSAARECQAV